MKSSSLPLSPDSRLAAVIAAARLRLTRFAPESDELWLLVDVAGQQLVSLTSAAPRRTWPVSTAAAGLDNREGSGGTPPGVHRIERRIGDGAAAGTVFVSREPTGRVWSPADTDTDDLILTRVLTLDGCEDGVNRGGDVDSARRYIYIHGTNHEDGIGTPCSHGCVRMGNDHVQELFDLVQEGTAVVIV